MNRKELNEGPVILPGILCVGLGISHAWWYWIVPVCLAAGIYYMIRALKRRFAGDSCSGEISGIPGENNSSASASRQVNHGPISTALQQIDANRKIVVEAGAHEDAVTISRAAEITGNAGRDDVVVNVCGGWRVITGEEVTIRGLTLQAGNGERMVLDIREGRVVVENCCLRGRICVKGNKTRLVIRDCLFLGGQSGLEAEHGARCTITQCQFSKIDDVPIAVRDGSIAEVADCCFVFDGYGRLEATRQAKMTLATCNLKRGMGICVEDSADVEITNCTIEDCNTSGVQVRGNAAASLTGCTITGCGRAGIIAKDARITVTECDVTCNGLGLIATGEASGAIRNSRFSGNFDGPIRLDPDCYIEQDEVETD